MIPGQTPPPITLETVAQAIIILEMETHHIVNKYPDSADRQATTNARLLAVHFLDLELERLAEGLGDES